MRGRQRLGSAVLLHLPSEPLLLAERTEDVGEKGERVWGRRSVAAGPLPVDVACLFLRLLNQRRKTDSELRATAVEGGRETLRNKAYSLLLEFSFRLSLATSLNVLFFFSCLT